MSVRGGNSQIPPEHTSNSPEGWSSGGCISQPCSGGYDRRGMYGRCKEIVGFDFICIASCICFYIFVKNNNAMKQIVTTIRVDADLKAEFDKLCDEFGMSANTAFNIYVKTVVRQRRIPFQIEANPIDDVMERGRKAFYEMRKTAAENGTAGMSLEEINEEIRLARRGE